MKTKIFFLATALLFLLASCSETKDVEIDNGNSQTEEPAQGSEEEENLFPDAIIIKELPRIDRGVIFNPNSSKIIQSKEELNKIFNSEDLATLPDINSIDFSEQTLLLDRADTYNYTTSIEYTYTKEGDSTYLYKIKASGIPTVYYDSFTYGIIVKKLPPTAKVTFSFEEVGLHDTAIDKEETKKFQGTWKTSYPGNYGNAVIVFKGNGTIGLYSPFEEDAYYVYPNNILRIDGAVNGPPQLHFEYEFLSETELIIYNFINEFITNEVKNISFIKISDKEIDIEEAEKEQFIGTWKTDYETNGDNNILIFKEDGTVGFYEPFDGEDYRLYPNNTIQINMFGGQSALSFKYAFISDTELMLYNFVTGFIDNNAVKNILFIKQPE